MFLKLRSWLLVMCLTTGSWASGSTVLDTLLKGKEYRLPTLDSSLRSRQVVSVASTPEKTQGAFTVQLAAMSDMDAAQKMRTDLQARLAMNVQLVFESPFYKLRTGNFKQKSEADDLVRKLSEQGVQALVIRLQ